MTKSGAATAATGLQQKAVLRGLRSRFAADGRKSRQDAGSSMFEVRLFGAKPWWPWVRLKKNGEPGGSPFFLFPYAAVYVEDINDGAHRKSGV